MRLVHLWAPPRTFASSEVFLALLPPAAPAHVLRRPGRARDRGQEDPAATALPATQELSGVESSRGGHFASNHHATRLPSNPLERPNGGLATGSPGRFVRGVWGTRSQKTVYMDLHGNRFCLIVKGFQDFDSYT